MEAAVEFLVALAARTAEQIGPSRVDVAVLAVAEASTAPAGTPGGTTVVGPVTAGGSGVAIGAVGRT